MTDKPAVRFTEKQLEYIRMADKRWNFKVGATRSGKTFVDIRHVIPRRIRERVGKPGLAVILGVTKGTIERNIIEPMREIFGEKLVGVINHRNVCRMFGENVYCLGAEKACQAAKLRGASMKYVYGDEVGEWSRELFELLKSRLDKGYSCFDGALNPEGPGHWLKAFLDSADDLFVQNYNIDDNIYLPGRFVEALKREYEGTVYYDRYILGKWTAADGLIFPMFSHKRHVEDSSPECERYWVSIDYGIQNATAMLLFGYSGGVWHCVDEFYHNGRESGRQLTDEDYYNQLVRLAEANKAVPERVIVDPSAASFIALIRRKGRFAVKCADNAVMDGIRNCCSAFNGGVVKINVKCRNTLKELSEYQWDTAAGAEKPLKINDHACDAFRYFIRTARIVR